MFKKELHPLDSRHPNNIAATQRVTGQREAFRTDAARIEKIQISDPAREKTEQVGVLENTKAPLDAARIEPIKSAKKKRSLFMRILRLPFTLLRALFATYRMLTKIYAVGLLLVVAVIMIEGNSPLTKMIVSGLSDLLTHISGSDMLQNGLATSMYEAPAVDAEGTSTLSVEQLSFEPTPTRLQSGNGSKFMSAPDQ